MFRSKIRRKITLLGISKIFVELFETYMSELFNSITEKS